MQMIGEAADLDRQLQILNRTGWKQTRAMWKKVIRALGLDVQPLRQE